MLERHVYTCRTPQNALKVLALWVAFALTVIAHIWVDDYFRRVGTVVPLVNGKSLPKAAIDASFNMTHIWTLAPAAPSLSQLLFLRLEKDREGLHYRFLKGTRIIQGRSDWKDVMVSRHANDADLGVPGHWIVIPAYLSHYREFLRDVEANCPPRPISAEADEPFPDDDGFLEPEVRRQVGNELRAGRKIQAIALVRLHTGVGLKEAKDHVEQWEPGTSDRPVPTFTPAPATLRQRINSLGCGLALYVVQVAVILYF